MARRSHGKPNKRDSMFLYRITTDLNRTINPCIGLLGPPSRAGMDRLLLEGAIRGNSAPANHRTSKGYSRCVLRVEAARQIACALLLYVRRQRYWSAWACRKDSTSMAGFDSIFKEYIILGFWG